MVVLQHPDNERQGESVQAKLFKAFLLSHKIDVTNAPGSKRCTSDLDQEDKIGVIYIWVTQFGDSH